MDGGVEEAFAAAFRRLTVTRILCDVRNEPRIEHALPIAGRITATIEVEIGASEVYPDGLGHGVRPVAMEHTEVELLLGREMPHTGHKRLPEGPIISPFGKNLVDSCVVDSRLALGVVRDGEGLPLHPRIWWGNLAPSNAKPLNRSPCRVVPGA